MDDYPLPRDQPEVAAASDRLKSLVEILWRPERDSPPDLRVCPPQLIMKRDKLRMVRDCSDSGCGLCWSPLTQSWTAAQLCCPRFAASRRLNGRVVFAGLFPRLAGPRRVSALPGCSPFCVGLGPSPGWNDYCVGEIARLAARVWLSLKIIDFVDDRSVVRAQLVYSMARLM